MIEAIWLYCKNLQNLENLDFLITSKLPKCPKGPFVRSALICIAWMRKRNLTHPKQMFDRGKINYNTDFLRYLFEINLSTLDSDKRTYL